MLTVEVTVPAPARQVWQAVSDFYGFSRRFPLGGPVTSRLSHSNLLERPRRRIEYKSQRGMGSWVVQELQVCDEQAMVMVTRSLSSRMPGGESTVEMVRVEPDGSGSKVELIVGYRPRWYLALLGWVFKRKVKAGMRRALEKMDVGGEASLPLPVLQHLSLAQAKSAMKEQPEWVQRVLSKAD